MFFRYFWTLTRKTWILPENFEQNCHNYILLSEGGSWRAKLLKGSLESLKFFRIIIEVFGTIGKTFFRVATTATYVQGNNLRKRVFSIWKFFNFSRLWAIFSLLAKKSLRVVVVKSATYEALDYFEEESCLKLCTRFQSLRGFVSKQQSSCTEKKNEEKISFTIVLFGLRQRNWDF